MQRYFSVTEMHLSFLSPSSLLPRANLQIPKLGSSSIVEEKKKEKKKNPSLERITFLPASFPAAGVCGGVPTGCRHVTSVWPGAA